MILQHPISRPSLSPSPSLHHNLIMLFIGFSILSYPIWSYATSIGYAKPYVKPSHSNLFSSYIQIINISFMGQKRYPSKSWVFKIRLSFKVRQHGKQQLNLQYKMCWIFYKMVGSSLIFTTLLLHTTTPASS